MYNCKFQFANLKYNVEINVQFTCKDSSLCRLYLNVTQTPKTEYLLTFHCHWCSCSLFSIPCMSDGGVNYGRENMNRVYVTAVHMDAVMNTAMNMSVAYMATMFVS